MAAPSDHRPGVLVLVATLVLALLALSPTARADDDDDDDDRDEAAAPALVAPTNLVALGDSFAAGPLIPSQHEQPWGCLRSNNNYAHQLARELSLELTDVTCSGADTKDMWETHGVSPEEEFAEYGEPFGYEGHPGNPPQLDALTAGTDVVTLQIGGNDIGFGGIATTCGEAGLRGQSCREAVAAGDPFGKIERTAPKITAVLDEIHLRAPDARIFVLGYSGIFKIGPTASCESMLVGEDDAQYLRSIQEALNAMIRDVAESHVVAAPVVPADDDRDEDDDDDDDRDDEDDDDRVRTTTRRVTTYVDVYGPSEGHTACDLPLIRWVEPIVPVNAAAPVHPNLGGMTAIADILEDEIWPIGLPRPDAQPGLPAPPDSPI